MGSADARAKATALRAVRSAAENAKRSQARLEQAATAARVEHDATLREIATASGLTPEGVRKMIQRGARR